MAVIQFSLLRKVSDIRRALTYLVMFASGPLAAVGVPQLAAGVGAYYADDPWQTIRNFMLNLTDQVMFLGWLRERGGEWTMTRDTNVHKHIYAALLHVASCGFHLHDCVSMRLGTGKDSVPGLSEFADYLMCWWEPEAPHDIFTQEGAATDHLKLRILLGRQKSTAHWIQFLTVDANVTDEVQR